MEGFYGLLKLTTGEELIAKVVNDDGGNYLIEDPVQMFRNVAPNGMTWIQCSHWLLFNKSSLVNIRKEHVLAIVEDLNAKYGAKYGGCTLFQLFMINITA